MILRDNTIYSFAENIEEYLSLQNISNRKFSELLDENGNNLLVYPHSFYHCEDETSNKPILSLQTNWDGKKYTRATLETGNIAGFIEANSQSISILSRFSQNTEEDFFMHYMLSKVLCINIVNLSHGTNKEQIFNFLLYLFPKFLNDALKQGLYKEYQRKEYNDANVRGTINISRHLKSNMPFNGRVAYGTREFSHDNHVTELIRHTIEYISMTKLGNGILEIDADTRTNVTQIISATPNYNKQEREKIVKSNLKTFSHPYYSHYEPLQKLCLRILQHEKIKYKENDNKINGILFDVSYLWEEYLAKLLTKLEFKHPNNKRNIGRIYLDEHNMLPRYPDFYKERACTIIDAKYKKKIDRDDIHQMISYMYRLKGKSGIFIQPTDIETTNKIYELLGYGTESKAELQTYYYIIPQKANNYKHFVAEIIKSENKLIADLSI